MLSFDDPRWAEMMGGYRIKFDPRPLLQLLRTGSDTKAAWAALWDELHHQGDVGEASFAAIPEIVRSYCDRGVPDGNAYAMIAVIELARSKGENPDVPEWLREEYFAAISALAERGYSELKRTEDADLCCAILGVLAIEKGLRNLARLLFDFSETELANLSLREAN
ncbi:MAG TPA: hypothetical protein VMD55_02910 [Terracidiphilus sp.]|nr:hypothetical protein [Terracidiphilus sp.]